MKIFLTGMPGSGKSTIAKIFADRYNFVFLDTDELIEKNTGMKISEIFKIKGEKTFREYERKLLDKLFEKENIIVATGGGFPCYFDNMQRINDLGFTVFLKVSVEILAKRLKDDKCRPQLSGLTETELIAQLDKTLRERKKYYEKAKFIINAGKLPEELAELIFSYLQNL